MSGEPAVPKKAVVYTFETTVDLALSWQERSDVLKAVNRHHCGYEDVPLDRKMPPEFAAMRPIHDRIRANNRLPVRVDVLEDGTLDVEIVKYNARREA